ncbi:MAG: Rieske (2Fe-2S) protein [Bacteroidota bacterium]
MSDRTVVLFEKIEDAFKIIKDREMVSILVDGQPFGLARFEETLYIFDRACPHAGYDLTNGRLSPLGTIVCPWHNYQFKLANGQELSERCQHLHIQKIEISETGQLCYLPWT